MNNTSTVDVVSIHCTTKLSILHERLPERCTAMMVLSKYVVLTKWSQKRHRYKLNSKLQKIVFAGSVFLISNISTEPQYNRWFE